MRFKEEQKERIIFYLLEKIKQGQREYIPNCFRRIWHQSGHSPQLSERTHEQRCDPQGEAWRIYPGSQ